MPEFHGRALGAVSYFRGELYFGRRGVLPAWLSFLSLKSTRLITAPSILSSAVCAPQRFLHFCAGAFGLLTNQQ
jgi:hypothetical protein